MSSSLRYGWLLVRVAMVGGGWLLASGCQRCEDTDLDGDGFVDCENIVATEEEPTGSFVKISAGDNQSSLTSTMLPDPIVVMVENNAGGGSYNVRVTFEVTSGGGVLDKGDGVPGTKISVSTGTDGLAPMRWRLGDPGAQTVRVTFAGRSNSLEFMAVAHRYAAQLLAIRGAGQTAAPGGEVPVRPTVRVTDIDDRPVVRALVAFRSDAGTDRVLTNRQGEATMSVPWVLGTAAGTYHATAAVLDSPGEILGNPATFTAFAVPTTAIAMAKAAGDNQETTRGTAVPTPPAVRLTDQFGNGVPGVEVTFSRETAGAQVSDSAKTTDSNGIAAVGGWSLGVEGVYRLVATVAGSAIGGNPATFTATAVAPAGIPAQVLIVSGDDQTGEVDVVLPTRLVVRVLDAQGRPVAGQLVHFMPGAASGTIAPAGTVNTDPEITDVGGYVRSRDWKLGTVTGVQHVSLDLPFTPGLQTPVFHATATPGRTQRLIKIAGDNTQAMEGTLLPTQSLPQVRIVDQFNNPIRAVTVSFTVGRGSGTVINPAVVATDANGTARPGGWKLGPTSGQNTMAATAVARTGTVISPFSVTFTATGLHP